MSSVTAQLCKSCKLPLFTNEHPAGQCGPATEPSVADAFDYFVGTYHEFEADLAHWQAVDGEARGFHKAIALLKEAAGTAFANGQDDEARETRKLADKLAGSSILTDLVRRSSQLAHNNMTEIEYEEAREIFTEVCARHGIELNS